MKVRDLMNALAEHDLDLEVLIAQDPEGNGFHGADQVEPGSVWGEPATTWRFDSVDEGENPVVVIWP